MPTEKAHGYQIAKMCESFASQGIDVNLIVPKRTNDIDENIFNYYKIKNNFKITYLDSFDFFKWEKIIGSKFSFYLQSLVFKLKVKKFNILNNGVVISRNPEIVQAISNKKVKVFYDAHRWPESKSFIFKKMLKDCAGIICNSKGTAKVFGDNGFKNILTAPNGVDLSEYSQIINREEIRRKYNLPIDKIIIMYVGHLYAWKGIDVIIEAAKFSENNNVFVFVGGTKKDIDKYKMKVSEEKIGNIIFLGHKKKEEISALQMSANVLLLPNIAINKESEKYTSPIKMFEYLASGVPIVASDLPSIREVLNEKNSLLFIAGDANALNNEIIKIVNKKINIDSLTKQAKIDVQKYSWLIRTKKIIEFIK